MTTILASVIARCLISRNLIGLSSADSTDMAQLINAGNSALKHNTAISGLVARCPKTAKLGPVRVQMPKWITCAVAHDAKLCILVGSFNIELEGHSGVAGVCRFVWYGFWDLEISIFGAVLLELLHSVCRLIRTPPSIFPLLLRVTPTIFEMKYIVAANNNRDYMAHSSYCC